MKWNIVYSDKARQDLLGIYTYIADELLAPKAASEQTKRIMKAIRSLEEMPMRYRLFDDEPWHSKGLRLFPVNNFLVLYLPVKADGTVNIVRIMFGGRDIGSKLNEAVD
ncbi:MAG: type II toxin-antitoxin system RelE/ParE family toxin [Acutalibacteraceae bacterium]